VNLLTQMALGEEIFHANNLHDVERYDTICEKESFQETVSGLPLYYFDGLSRIEPSKVNGLTSFCLFLYFITGL